ncbi:LLM class flavin-dependent oxidoreductase [Dysgonomonas capnocytophagoides]|uniref:LLM class flavin-dependent oxidoreductase n=1 Tax=Dysgonomonas capnocytophagoides TaxID=45254 RepID=UPI0004089C4D|nr:LLM class flavin-dependent oxidoreductase [Dysgonomonas capnocytophagoides]
MAKQHIKLSVLDQSPINKGKTSTDALNETTRLAELTDSLGYTRFWVSEHHNAPTLAGSTPEILIAHLANHTKKMRIGSGGIMLPNHSSLKAAESFRLLEALYPGRIDMGIGRAPGTDRLTASILNPTNKFDEQDFIQQLYDLSDFFHDSQESGSVSQKVKAIPVTKTVPPRWLLTSSGESGLIAAHFGLGLSYAQFINPYVGANIIQGYRRNFKPSSDLKEPQANVAIFVFCNEDEEVVKRQQALMDYRFIQLERGGNLVAVHYEDIITMPYTEFERQRIQYNRGRTIMGTPEIVKKKLTALAETYDIDEIMLVTYAEKIEDRLHSYELLAKEFNISE